jgi:hypothetical protein
MELKPKNITSGGSRDVVAEEQDLLCQQRQQHR